MRFGPKTKFLAVMFLGVLAACTDIPSDVIVKTSSSDEAPLDGLLKDYRQWTRVNPVPVVFSPNVAIMCSPGPSQMEKGNPHRDKFLTVYVNELGTKSMMNDKNPRFPLGSVIVKEKLPSKDSNSPELLTVMIKREAGYNPENGDWEYMAVDGAGKEVQARGRLDKCQACHTTMKNSDYVYRNYLPSAAWDKLK